MILTKCYIENFGRLHQFSWELERGFNGKCSANGSGKTTFAAFLRAMFYGMPPTRTKKSLDDAERKKYRPWQGGTWGGYLCFECRGKNYKLERTYGEKDREDTFRLIDLTTGLESQDYSTDIGYEIFGVDRAAFSSTLHIMAPSMRVEVNDSISARLGSSDGDESRNNYENAILLIDKEYKRFIKTGGRGLIGELEQEQLQMEQQIWDKSNALRNRKEQLIQLKQNQFEPQNGTVDETSNLTETSSLTKEESSRLEWLDDYFSGGVPEQEEIAEQKRKIELQKRTYDERQQKRSNRSIAYNTANKNRTHRFAVLLFVFVLGTVLEIALGIVQGSAIHWAVAVGLGLLSLATGSVTMKSNQRRRQDDFSEDSSAKMEMAIHQKEQKLLELERNRMEYLLLSEKEEHAKHSEELVRSAKRSAAVAELTTKCNQLADEISSLKMQKEEQKEELLEHKKNAEILRKTKECLEQTKTQYSVSYMEGIQKHFLRYLAMLDQDLARKASINAAFHVNMIEQGLERQMEYYSSGYKDMIWFCERLSLIESLFTKEKPVLILDDPFINLDDEMLQKALSMLEQLEDHYQIVYMTCQTSRMP